MSYIEGGTATMVNSNNLRNQFIRHLEENKMLSYGRRLLVGVSGGPDSVCLFHLLYSLRETYGLYIACAHINHGIRGEQATADERFVTSLCNQLSIPCHVMHAEILKVAKEQGISSEEAGRRIRYAFFAQVLREEKLDAVCTAHNCNDAAETVLFQLFRGTGIDGAAGINPCGLLTLADGTSLPVVRPLLFAQREQILAYLAEHTLAYCIDESNESDQYARNRIRRHILPYATEQINSASVVHVAAFGRQMSELSRLLTELTEQAFAECTRVCAEQSGEQVYHISITELLSLSPYLAGRVLLQTLSQLTGSARDFTSEHVRLIEALCDQQSGKKISLPYGITCRREYDTLVFRNVKEKQQRAEAVYIPISGTGVYPAGEQGGHFTVTMINVTEAQAKLYAEKSIMQNSCNHYFDYDKIKNILVVRGRLPHDSIQIHKDGRHKSIRKLMIEEKVPMILRDKLMLLASGSDILWIPGIRASEGYHIEIGTRTIIAVEFRKGEDTKDGE